MPAHFVRNAADSPEDGILKSPLMRLQILQWSVAGLLVLMVVGGAALIHWGPVRGYVIACDKTQAITCELQRDTAQGVKSWQVSLGADAAATVHVKHSRRGPSRIFLYLKSGAQSVFAAEFEGSDAVAQAQSAADRLNQVFASPTPVSLRLELGPPPHMWALLWGGFGFLVLLVLVTLRKLFQVEARPNERSG